MIDSKAIKSIIIMSYKNEIMVKQVAVNYCK